jgi:transcriptional regulator with XRE-family HTH domain
MDSVAFRTWRKSLGLKQKEAAEKLGLKKRMIQYYETGRRGSKTVVIPKTVELACYALSRGVEAFDGGLPQDAPASLAAVREAPGDQARLRAQEAA